MLSGGECMYVVVCCDVVWCGISGVMCALLVFFTLDKEQLLALNSRGANYDVCPLCV